MILYTIDDVKQALALPNFDGQAAHWQMAPRPRPTIRPRSMHGKVRLGGVLIMLYCLNGSLHIVLTRRPDTMKNHAGQISFPGGRNEENETLQRTALREAHEEVGIRPSDLVVLGQLTTLYILPSDFEVTPFVGWYPKEERPFFQPNADEVAEILEVPLAHLLDPVTRQEEVRQFRGMPFQVPFFAVNEDKVWGATAMMLNELLERLRVTIPNS